MGKLDRMMRRAGLLLCLSLAACSSRPAPPEQGAASTPRPDRKRAKAALITAPDPRFDEAGNLKPSALHASWLELPSGFVEQPGATQRLSLYVANDMPYAKARAYLQARLQPEKLEFPTGGISFREALPTHTSLTMPPLNVLLVETDRSKREVRLVVEDLSPPPGKPLSVDNAAQALAHDRSRIE